MGILRNILVLIIVLATLGGARVAQAESVCVVMSKNIPPYIEALKGIKTVIKSDIKRINLDGKREKGGEAVNIILKSDCKVVVPIGSLALDVVRIQITDLPIVYSMVASPSPAVEQAKNIAGVNIEPSPKDLLASLKRLLPNISKVGLVYNPVNASRFASAAEKAAKQLGVGLELRQAGDMRSMAEAVKSLMPKVDAMLMAPDPTTSNRKAFEFLLLECFRRGIPLIGLSKKHVRDGALFSFDIHYNEIGRKTGKLVKKVQQEREVVTGLRLSSHGPLVINLKTAKRLGLHINQAIINSAAHVYK